MQQLATIWAANTCSLGDLEIAVECYELEVCLNVDSTEARQNLKLALEQKEHRAIKVSHAR
ncbi:hypothetical protein [Myxosarcina sp. GI1]|uniref:hypothetical protein n=1 Tax=Myxosarcina sp. GI1 TaxID=1541065 RepID=UPI00056A4C21|nr:hypothetical protein [Myxosarcina sp. GI1]